MWWVSQIYPPCCALPYRLTDKNVHYSKLSKTRKNPRKSFPERWEPAQKRAGSATCGEMMPGAPSVFRTYQGRGILLPPFGSTAFCRRRIQPAEFRTPAVRPFHGLPCSDKLFARFFLTPSTQKPLRTARRRPQRHLQNMDRRGAHFPSPHFHTFSSAKRP